MGGVSSRVVGPGGRWFTWNSGSGWEVVYLEYWACVGGGLPGVVDLGGMWFTWSSGSE